MSEAQSLRILAIDDDRSSLYLLETVANRSQCQIRVCGDSTRAVEIAREFQPHLILLDIVMPCMDGFDVAKALHEIVLAEYMLVAFTACSEAKYRSSCEALGFDDYVTKPVSLEQLQMLFNEASQRTKSSFTPCLLS